MELLEDGSIKGQTFSGDKYKGKYPSPKEGEETYRQYYERVQKCKKRGFHLGDLSWSDWETYCYGSPHNDEDVGRFIIGQVPDEYWNKRNEIEED